MNCIIFVFSFLFDMKSDVHIISMTFYLYKCSNNNIKKKKKKILKIKNNINKIIFYNYKLSMFGCQN